MNGLDPTLWTQQNKLRDDEAFRFPNPLVTPEKLGRYFLRFPQEGQSFERIKEGLSKTNQLLAGVRSYWHGWNPFHGEITWESHRPIRTF